MPPHYSYYRSQCPEPVPPKPRPWKWYTLAAVALVIVGTVLQNGITSTKPTIAKAAKSVAATAPSPQMVNAIKQLIASDTTDRVGVAIENINTGEVTTYGDTAPFEAASTEKVLSAIVYYHLVEKGVVSLEDTLGDYSADYQIKEMINISDNDSWNLVNEAVGGNDELAAYAKLIGVNYNADDNTISPNDMATLLGKLYSGKLLNAEHTQELLSYMQNTNDESMIPSVMPSNVTVYHKYGDLTNFDDNGNSVLHDAAIVVNGQQAYALVVYTSGGGAADARSALIQKIAAAAVQGWGW